MDVDALLQEALEKRQKGDNEAARKLFQRVLSEEPKHFNARLNLASLAIDTGHAARGRRLLEELIAEDETSGVAHLLLARACFISGEHERGYREIQRAHELLPEDDGVTGEYVAAMRRRVSTFNAEEYKVLREVAAMGQLKDTRWQRLAQLTLARMVSDQLIRLIVDVDASESKEDAITRYQSKIPLERQSALSVMARDLQEYVDHFKAAYPPQRCNVQLRRKPGAPEDEPASCSDFTDVDSLTGATLELVKLHDVEFIPFANIRSVEFGEATAAVPAMVTLAGGRTISGLVPLFYLFTDFCGSDRVRSGRMTKFRAIIPGVVAGVGMRAFNSSRGLLPMANIERMDFIG